VVTLLGVAVCSCAMAILLTWPQARHPTLVADHFDPYFSIWRLGHVAHALTRWPIALFDGNIFYPASGTLAYSDAVLLEGLIGAPLLWAHLSPSLVYNLLLLAGFAGSGVGMFVLARHLTGEAGPALVAATIFTALPYRMEHVMHLELQWAMWIPLAFWAVHRTMESGRWRHGILVGVFVWLQFISCIYYGVFLSITLLLFVPLLLTFKGHAAIRRFAPPLLTGALVAALLTLPYAVPYIEATHAVGDRPMGEIVRYSAHLSSYLASNSLNRVWGWTADLWGAPELRLFPGLLAMLLGVVALRHPRRRLVALYAAVVLVVVQLSLGLNGLLYSALLGHVSALKGFRATARFGIIVGAALGILAALGTQALFVWIRAARRWRLVLIALVIAVMLVEYSNQPLPLSGAIDARPADVYQALRSGKPGPIAEFPVPLREALPGWDPYYMAWSVWHWRPLLNGYSGYYSQAYLDSLETLRWFPDADSIALLRRKGIRYVIVHREFYKREEYTELALQLATTPELTRWGVYKDPVGLADILELQPLNEADLKR
jgi:hypothetical protein